MHDLQVSLNDLFAVALKLLKRWNHFRKLFNWTIPDSLLFKMAMKMLRARGSNVQLNIFRFLISKSRKLFFLIRRFERFTTNILDKSVREQWLLKVGLTCGDYFWKYYLFSKTSFWGGWTPILRFTEINQWKVQYYATSLTLFVIRDPIVI